MIMREFYIRSKDTELNTEPCNREADATMIFWKECEIDPKKCPTIEYFKALGATPYAYDQRHCFNFDPNVNIDLLRKYGEESKNICLYCQCGTKRR